MHDPPAHYVRSPGGGPQLRALERQFYAHAFTGSGDRLIHEAPRSRSTMMQRTRMSATAIEYAHAASAMTSMPMSMIAAIFGAATMLTDDP
jgi:hypothetical protein